MTRSLFKELTAADNAFWEMSARNLGTSWEQSLGGLSGAVGSWGRAVSWKASAGEERRKGKAGLLSSQPLDPEGGAESGLGLTVVSDSGVRQW